MNWWNMTAGCILFNKNPGLSSFESLGPVKKAFATGKVCHTGTLDKFAQGLLVILVGRAVKLSSWFTGCDKKYRAVFKFGEETDTLDPEGTIIANAPVPERNALEAILSRFTGPLLQAPPLYSAVHVNGQRAHKLARAGIEVEMKKREITIHAISLLSWAPPLAELEVHCSSGTYIRSLARDMALALDSRAHVVSLCRTRVGNFSLADAVSADAADPDMLTKALRPLDKELFAALNIPGIEIDEKTARAVSQGKDLQSLDEPLAEGPVDSNTLALFGPAAFAALIEKKEGRWAYGFVNAAV
jgi:tRNA pseudouridine55 synthase